MVRVDHADDLDIVRSMRERKTQCARFVSSNVILIDELEAFTERSAMVLDRTPKRRIRCVVDDDDALEVGIVETGDRIERRFEHVRRLTMGRDVDRYFRGKTVGRG